MIYIFIGMKNFKINHIAYVVKDLSESSELFMNSFKYKIIENEVIDELQDVTVQFLYHQLLPTVELIMPNSEKSPSQNALQKGGGINHIAYDVNDINEEIKYFETNKFKLVKKPLPGSAHNNKLVCFLYHSKMGLIELVEKNI